MSDFVAITVFAGLPVRNLDSAIQWYSQVFGRAPDGRPTPLIADYYLAASQVPENGTLQLREDAGRAGGGLTTINVDDIEVVARALEALHVSLETQRFPIEAETVSEVTVGTFEDPDGNAITVVQPHRR
jgi:predicted enzyme related to lactoylglutathione lyase